jgi:hypothetical protein
LPRWSKATRTTSPSSCPTSVCAPGRHRARPSNRGQLPDGPLQTARFGQSAGPAAPHFCLS